ncbi:hypothetical protein HSBAA_18610 [Vreelandella sulfidaeris]|uniref:GmrSD restriction endonucleases N-terminal domain-containing protein n=1 Tax=Vreelandella sulfidaeris TaxID=115553 RepID=A0A455U3V9_9GAMM|nr:hypothetical protein HSBAA_18610 [Halomonas sulfidaeris]
MRNIKDDGSDSSTEKGVLTVKQLLEDSSLTIPEYQRPYKWTPRNINQLFADIVLHKDKSAYRLGTVVFTRRPMIKTPVKLNATLWMASSVHLV